MSRLPDTAGPPAWLEQALRADTLRWQYLQQVRQQLGSGFWPAAGFVRNLVWDQQHGYRQATPLQDIDVIYLDADCTEPYYEQHYQHQLHARLAAAWQVRNQARMAQQHGHPPYRSCAEAIGYWPETATCYAVRVDEHDQLHWLAPLGWAPLFARQIQRNPAFSGDDASWQRRLQRKNWRQRWPQLQLEPNNQ
ncbi:nucleotidyltransferase family protein [Vogesella sp. GCM10023246]|uniref:Nucleotidyltransferase family protein n=1 Tax=Vogesella oryzagri TaxID=3160864 RepID=A0ABV1M612_9NEIS